MDRNGGDDAVRCGIDDGHGSRLCIDHVNLVANGVHGKARWIHANLQRMVLAKIDEVENRDGIRAAVAHIGILAVTVRNVGKAAAATAGTCKEERERADSNKNTRGNEKVTRGWHCSESIDDADG